MKWKTTAYTVINRLCSFNLISNYQSNNFLTLIDGGNPINAFKQLQDLMTEAGWQIGWNKVINTGSILGWYGSVVISQPIRLAAIEIENDIEIWESARQYLLDIWHETCKSAQSKCNESTIRLLKELGVNTLSTKLDSVGTALLHRLNLDKRAMPIIERWRWSGQTGQVILSDGGRFQFKQELAIARSIEAGIDTTGKISSLLHRFLTKLIKDQSDVELSSSETDENVLSYLSRLEMYRLVKRDMKRIRFYLPVGNFPALALKLWG
ncbi:MAG: hypothetical protein P9X24_00175 [Candidatus Hatepunaea meridiana]|nr:hypothetical protein [Candidatus Hatepunaea meridiana]